MFAKKPTRKAALVVSLCLWASAAPAAAQDMLWESQGLTDEASIPSGSVFSYGGGTVTMTWTMVTDGGMSIFLGGAGSLNGGDDYVSYESSTEGAHTGLALLAFNNASNDPDDYVQVTFTFSSATSNLAFTMLDIDTGSWDDGVEIIYNGSTNVRDNASWWSYAESNPLVRTVSTDNEFGYEGFEGVVGGASSSTDDGNLTVNLSGVSVTSVRIRFFSTDDASADPGAQKIGISDLLFLEPDFTMVKSDLAVSDPTNGTSNPKNIPGGIVEYAVLLTNSGSGSSTVNTVFLTDPIPTNVKLRVADLGGGGSGPVSFTNGTPTSSLTYTFAALSDTTDDLLFSNNNGSTYTYAPVADADGCDATVTHIKVNPKGTFAASSGSDPSCTFRFRVRVK